MGLSSRDYIRDDQYSRGGDGWLSDTPAVRNIIILTVVVFILQLVITARTPIVVEGVRIGNQVTSLIDQWFALENEQVQRGQVWRLVTYAFLHDRDSLWHILFNMLFFWFAGSTFERMYGSRELWLFYLTAAGVSGLAEFLVGTTLRVSGPTVGASGAVMAVFMVFGMLYPRRQVYVWFIPIEVRWLIAFYVVSDLFPLLKLIGGEDAYEAVAHAAHLSGLLFGYLYYRGQWRLDRTWSAMTSGWSLRWRRMTVGRKLKVYDPQPTSAAEPVTDLEAELDRILAKIHEQGTGSLTPQEERILAEASERAKRRGVTGEKR